MQNLEPELQFKAPEHTYLLEDLGYPVGIGFASNLAISEPFHLLSTEDLSRMRRDFRGSILLRSSKHGLGTQAQGTLDGFGGVFWKHPRTLEYLSRIAGTSLVLEGLPQINELWSSSRGSEMPWHRSDAPFLCVLLLSNMEEIQGGSVCFRGPSQEIKTLKTWSEGSVVLIQGSLVDHKVTPFTSLNPSRPRVTVIVALRPKLWAMPFMKLPNTDFARLYTELAMKISHDIHEQLNTLDVIPSPSHQRMRKNGEVMKEIAKLVQNISDQLGVLSSPSEVQLTSAVEVILKLQAYDARQQIEDLMEDFNRYIHLPTECLSDTALVSRWI